MTARQASGQRRQRLRLWLRLLRATRLIENDVRERLKSQCGTTLPRFDVLAVLDRHPHGLTMSELSRKLEVSNGNVTGIVERLVTEGLILRQRQPGDRRVLRVQLSRRGQRAFEDLAAWHEQWVDEIVADFGAADTESLVGLLDALKLAIQEARH